MDITNNIKLPNKELDVLKTHFAHCFDKNGGFDFEKFRKQIAEADISFSRESYGMDWLGKAYARLLASDAATTLLKEDTAHRTQAENENAQNLLLKGDNLEVLKHLSNAYFEKIKMIYIDPPYNTGSDGFVYHDDRKFTASELQNLAGISRERAERILYFTQSKSNSHSAWLTFMYPRLYIAKRLLKDDGVIFISIDDNEVAQLRLLMDEIFGEENFVAEFVWSGKSGSEDDSHIRNNKEYILCYAKEIGKFNTGLDVKKDEKFIYYDKIKNENYKRQLLRKWGDNSSREDRPNLYYAIKDGNGNDFYPTLPSGEDGCWRWSKETMQTAIDNGMIEFATNGRYEAYEKIYESDLDKKQKKFQSLLLDLGSSASGTKEIKNIFNDIKIFSNPKPTKLLLQLFLIGNTKQSDLILDFFAGSGTTGDAVMQLNAEDGGNRQFILVQLPEAIDAKSNKAAYDFVQTLNTKNSNLKTTEVELKTQNSKLKTIEETIEETIEDDAELKTKNLKLKTLEEPTIFDITKERLLRAAAKVNAGLDEKNKDAKLKIKNLEGQLQTAEIKQEIKTLQTAQTKNSKLKTQNSFKVFETMDIWDGYEYKASSFDVNAELFDESTLTETDIAALLTTWKTYDNILLTESLQTVDLAGYTAQYGGEKLYLMDKGFTADTLVALLEKIDSDRDFKLRTIVAFGHHFESKNLREIAENIKSYRNKKQADIDFITRY